MKIPEHLEHYASVATFVELQGLIATEKRLEALLGNRLVIEYVKLSSSRDLLVEDLDARLDAADVEPDDAAA